MSFSGEMEHRGVGVSGRRPVLWMERVGGLVIRTNLETESIRLLWKRVWVGWLWHWLTPPLRFHYQRYHGDGTWTEVSVPVDTRPERLR